MEELAKKIQEKYIDEVTSKYPLHRFFCMYIYLLAIFIYKVKDESNFIDGIGKTSISFLFNFTEGLITKVSVLDLVWAVIITLIASWLTFWIKSSFFDFFCAITELKDYVDELKAEAAKIRPEDHSTELSMIAGINRQLEVKRSKLRSRQAQLEIIITFAACLLWGAKHFGWIEWLIIILTIPVVIYIQWNAYKTYISEFLPYYVTEQTLLGKDVVFVKNKDESDQ